MSPFWLDRIGAMRMHCRIPRYEHDMDCNAASTHPLGRICVFDFICRVEWSGEALPTTDSSRVATMAVPLSISQFYSSLSASAVCYDYTGRRAVFLLGKQPLPDIPGMRAEHLSVRRDKIVVSYSF